MTQILRGEIPTLSIREFNLAMIALLTFMDDGLRRSGYAKSAELWKDRKMVYLLVYPYLHCYSIVRTFPHEDIGRYPTSIDNQSSLELYPKYAVGLQVLLEQVRNDCSKIENAMLGAWDQA